jgi:hypothetical protein
MPWERGSTYDDLLNRYARYVTKYQRPCVVFDGYRHGPSTKDTTHRRRASEGPGPTVRFNPTMTLTLTKAQFLANPENKQRFIDYLSVKLEANGCSCIHAEGDADLLIVEKAVEYAATCTTVVVGADTDLLVLLLYHASMDSKDIFFSPEPKKNAKGATVYDIKASKSCLGLDLCTNLLFGHALFGCDTTSRLHGTGKGVAVKLLRENEVFREQAEVFLSNNSTQNDIQAAGEKALLVLYKGKPTETLDQLRARLFSEKVLTTTSFVKPETMPPTSAAAKFHSLRTYHQVQAWKGNKLNPLEWGWDVRDGIMIPRKTDLLPAPQALLELIRCKCKSGCHTMRCSCRKVGLDCSAVCGECRGVSCTNSPQPDLTLDDELKD